jgi:L-alanine-DL-glutamate epimerase-like enolase superfamily enzyme
VFVRVVADDGTEGYGSSAPNSVTNETVSTVTKTLSLYSQKLVGESVDIDLIHRIMDKICEDNNSAKSAIDIAIYDILGKSYGIPVYKLLSDEYKNKILTDMTIGIMSTEDAVERAIHYKREGFKVLKVKVGLNIDDDINRVKTIRNAVGSDIKIRLDANQGYSVKDAIRFANSLEDLDIEFIEQPVRADDLKGLKKVCELSKIPIMADECVKTSDDTLQITKYLKLVNIKLMKSKGIRDAIKICKILSDTNGSAMVGCMGESLLSITAGLHFSLSQPTVKYADLDSWFNIINDYASDGLKFEDGYLLPSDKPGFGVVIAKNRMIKKEKEGI